MIHVKQLKKSYGEKQVLAIDALEIPSGQSFGLVGNNGAGKTTLFSALLDLIRLNQGTITNQEMDVSSSETWKQFTTAFLDETFLIGYLTPEEYFYFIGDLRGVSHSDVDAFVGQFEDFFHREVLKQKKYLRDLSKGNQKKAGIVGALIGSPSVIVLDEPFANLDPSTQIRLKELLREWSQQKGVTLLISSHDLQHVTEVCERIVVLDKGEVVNDIKTQTQTLKDLEAFFTQKSQEG
ncbi:MAG: ABC transporter ATP-binding protein [Flavobacteriaceae bacterium]|nr:ABC transporter ATP-binding protein [Flavobacteriaceae bacterium]MDG2314693.1 ABC transporter ATP-binding protein [Flavobacteriaceae bacterium]